MTKKTTEDAMHRLGVPIVDCPRCEVPFSIRRAPRWWIITFVDGEIVDGGDDDLFCSAECAHAEAASRRQNQADKYGSTTTYFVSEDDTVAE